MRCLALHCLFGAAGHFDQSGAAVLEHFSMCSITFFFLKERPVVYASYPNISKSKQGPSPTGGTINGDKEVWNRKRPHLVHLHMMMMWNGCHPSLLFFWRISSHPTTAATTTRDVGGGDINRLRKKWRLGAKLILVTSPGHPQKSCGQRKSKVEPCLNKDRRTEFRRAPDIPTRMPWWLKKKKTKRERKGEKKGSGRGLVYYIFHTTKRILGCDNHTRVLTKR